MKSSNYNYTDTLCAALILIASFLLVGCSACGNRETKKLHERYGRIANSEFRDKARQYNADTRYLIIVDYAIPSNRDRLFIWDVDQNKIVEQFWCAHGFGGGSTPAMPVFSNTPGSNCSSLGWFLVDRSVGRSVHYGYNYHAVDGLDGSNSNARRRQILIHPWTSVTRDYEAQISHPMDLDYRCAGCFTTTDAGFKTIDRYVKSTSKRILLVSIN